MTSLFKNRLFVAAALLSTFVGFDAKGDIFTSCGVDLGFAGRTKSWAVLTLGGSFIQNISSDSDYEGRSLVDGDVGSAGHGAKMKMGGGAMIHGNVYLRTDGLLTVNDGASISGAVIQDAGSDALLDQAVIDAQNASDYANSLPATPGYPSTINTGSDMTLVLTGQCTVLRLTDFVLTGGTFTLVGTANQGIVINVSNNFSLKGGARVQLAGGLTPDSVLWNVTGPGNVAMSDQGSQLRGILLATQRRMSMKNYSLLVGEAIVNSLLIGSHSQILTPGANP